MSWKFSPAGSFSVNVRGSRPHCQELASLAAWLRSLLAGGGEADVFYPRSEEFASELISLLVQ